MHLGSRISALVDGQLDPSATERALAHVAACSACARELADARAARSALASAEPVLPTDDLTARLLSLSAQVPSPLPHRPASGDPFAVAGGAALPFAATHTLRGDVLARRTPTRLVVGSLAGLSAVAAGLFMLGERPTVTPSSHPATVLGLLAHTSAPDVDALPADTVAWLGDHGWTFPHDLPAGWQVDSVSWSSDGPRVLEVEVTGPAGTYVVSEQQGRLDTDAIAGAPVREVGGRQVHVLSVEPWQVAWQSESTVVQVVAAQDEGEIDALVAAFPSGGYDDTVGGRIQRGWQTVSGVWERP